jgi:hypothetical protein
MDLPTWRKNPAESENTRSAGHAGPVLSCEHVRVSMEDMDLVVVPRTRMPDVDPDTPNVESSIAKAAA